MSVYDDFRRMVDFLDAKLEIPPISSVYFPPLYPGGQPKDSEFIAIVIGERYAGVGFILGAEIEKEDYAKFGGGVISLINRSPIEYAKELGSDNIAVNTVAIAALNAICRYAMEQFDYKPPAAKDTVGHLEMGPDDTVGLIGLFRPLLGIIRRSGARSVILERDNVIIRKYHGLNIVDDPSALKNCNKIICTASTLINGTFEEIMGYCKGAEKVAILGPSAGFFPDPVFKRGVDNVGGTYISDASSFFSRITSRERWGDSGYKYLITKSDYPGLFNICKS